MVLVRRHTNLPLTSAEMDARYGRWWRWDRWCWIAYHNHVLPIPESWMWALDRWFMRRMGLEP